MHCLAEALKYAARKWKIIPVHSMVDGRCSCGATQDYYGLSVTKHAMGKHPYTEHGHKDASLDAGQINTWWNMWPNANVAIATGYRSNLIVLDVDKKNDGPASFARLVHQYGPLPRTPKVSSGGGGFHLYFQYPGHEIRGRRDMRPGIDVMADGGRIIAPPSNHKSGNVYMWDANDNLDTVSPAVIPRWLLTMIKTKNPPKKKISSWLRFAYR